MTKDRVTVSLDPETVDTIEEIKEGSRDVPEIWDMSKSEVTRELVTFSLEVIDGMETRDDGRVVELEDGTVETVRALRDLLGETNEHDR